MTTSTKTLLKALRTAGLTARSGFDPQRTPFLECANVVVLTLDGKPVVVNIQTFSVLGTYKGAGCINHPDYEPTKRGLTNRVREVLVALGTDFYVSGSDQFCVNDYRPSR